VSDEQVKIVELFARSPHQNAIPATRSIGGGGGLSCRGRKGFETKTETEEKKVSFKDKKRKSFTGTTPRQDKDRQDSTR
jgi:hypothetical protein